MNQKKHFKAHSVFFSFALLYKAILGFIAFYVFYPSILANYLHRLRGVKFEKINSNYIAFNVCLDSNYPELIEIREGAWITRGAMILAHFNPNPTLARIMPAKTAKVIIGKGAYICSNAIILPGVEIGEGAVVAAGSVVRKNVPPFKMVIGNPAQIV
jgi:acetyltransferase-like isoleucine patch superfamily enzyme